MLSGNVVLAIGGGMGLSWQTKLLYFVLFVIYPLRGAVFFHQSDDAIFRYGQVAFIAGGALLMNWQFLKNILLIFQNHSQLKNLWKEYLWAALMALVNIHIFSCFYYIFGVVHNGSLLEADWYNSYYFSMVTWTTLGYGDFSPPENIRLIAAFEGFVGYVYMALLVGLIFTIATKNERQ